MNTQILGSKSVLKSSDIGSKVLASMMNADKSAVTVFRKAIDASGANTPEERASIIGGLVGYAIANEKVFLISTGAVDTNFHESMEFKSMLNRAAYIGTKIAFKMTGYKIAWSGKGNQLSIAQVKEAIDNDDLGSLVQGFTVTLPGAKVPKKIEADGKSNAPSSTGDAAPSVDSLADAERRGFADASKARLEVLVDTMSLGDIFKVLVSKYTAADLVLATGKLRDKVVTLATVNTGTK